MYDKNQDNKITTRNNTTKSQNMNTAFYYISTVMNRIKNFKNNNKIMDLNPNDNRISTISSEDKWNIICQIIPSLKNHHNDTLLSLRKITFIENRLIVDFNITREELYNMYINGMYDK